MKAKQLSRGPDLDNELCVDNAGGNRFNLVIMAASRARELARRHRDSGSKEYKNTTMEALLEFQNGKLDQTYLKRVR